jgi:hypothetical protein
MGDKNINKMENKYHLNQNKRKAGISIARKNIIPIIKHLFLDTGIRKIDFGKRSTAHSNGSIPIKSNTIHLKKKCSHVELSTDFKETPIVILRK